MLTNTLLAILPSQVRMSVQRLSLECQMPSPPGNREIVVGGAAGGLSQHQYSLADEVSDVTR